jgi:type II secretory pathway component PulF
MGYCGDRQRIAGPSPGCGCLAAGCRGRADALRGREAVRLNPVFPDAFASLYASGEISGKLDDSLRSLARLYGEDGTNKLHSFAHWLPRLVYILVVFIIAYKIIQFYSGLYGSNSQLSNILNGP